ncbi:hypothetical protein SAMN02745226_01303 [Fervidobacterium gondwanense DSM 13020]|uniref:Uncharacterized protein n=1 Tax=Fervidobacterium gondwanense DSM 13020 TaxID=1121883 RepID=A0A1M7SVW4_FERGO|nr:hypothetical protein SAMN02745226_01303 [Fervidobacterium gondwanense DSM 13020]
MEKPQNTFLTFMQAFERLHFENNINQSTLKYEKYREVFLPN